MLIPRSISLSISFAALDWFRLARCRVLCAWPVRTLLRVAGPGITVVAKPAELRGFGVMLDGPGAPGVTPGLRMGGGGVCGTWITGGAGFALPLLTPAAWPTWGDESANVNPAKSSPGMRFRIACLLGSQGTTVGRALVFRSGHGAECANDPARTVPLFRGVVFR